MKYELHHVTSSLGCKRQFIRPEICHIYCGR